VNNDDYGDQDSENDDNDGDGDNDTDDKIMMTRWR